jgi:hypothetical protein
MGHWRAISPGATGSVTVISGASTAQLRGVRGPDRSDSQADSAGSIPVTRSKPRIRSSGHLRAMIARPPLCPLGTPACPLRARLAAATGTAGPSQLSPGHLVQRACELAVPLFPGMQVHPGGPGGGVAHTGHQLGQRGARLTGQCVAGMARATPPDSAGPKRRTPRLQACSPVMRTDSNGFTRAEPGLLIRGCTRARCGPDRKSAHG